MLGITHSGVRQVPVQARTPDKQTFWALGEGIVCANAPSAPGLKIRGRYVLDGRHENLISDDWLII